MIINCDIYVPHHSHHFAHAHDQHDDGPRSGKFRWLPAGGQHDDGYHHRQHNCLQMIVIVMIKIRMNLAAVSPAGFKLEVK